MSTVEQSESAGTKPAYTTANKVGFVLAIVIGVASRPSVLMPTPEGEVGPPLLVLALSSLLGLVIIAGAAIAWAKGSRPAIRAAAAALIIGVILTLPAFVTPDVPAPLRATAATFTLASLAAIVLMLMRGKGPRA